MNQKETKETRMKYAAIVAQCWQDDDFKNKFMEDPAGIMSEREMLFEKGKKYKVIEADKKSTYIVLPYEEGQEALQVLYKKINSLFNKGQQIIKPGCELRVIQNTPDTNYLVIPFPPALYTKEEKMELAKANGVADVESDVEAISEELAVMETTVVEAAEAATTIYVVVEGFIVVV